MPLSLPIHVSLLPVNVSLYHECQLTVVFVKAVSLYI